MSQKKSEVAYRRENELLEKYRAVADDDALTREEYKTAVDSLVKGYETLLGDTKLLTSVGDRLQRKLKSANMLLEQQAEEIQRINQDLQKTNVDLKNTIDELTRARASRRAQTFILVFAVVLMFLTEVLEEAVIEDLTFFDSGVANFMISLIPKALIVLLLKPIEGYTERYFVRISVRSDAQQRERMEIQEKFSTH